MTENPKPLQNLSMLCLLLALGAAIFAGLGIWMIIAGGLGYGLFSIAAGGLMGAAALGLYRQRRLGVVLFGLLVLLGSINHLANVISRYPPQALQQSGAAVSAAFSLLFAILIPLALLYLTLLLWKRSR